MKIYEYQAMALFKEYGIDVVPAELADKPGDAAAIAEKFAGKAVVKAQALTGGRGKAGGIKIVRSPGEAKDAARKILAMDIKGAPVKKVLVAEAIDILEEYYLGITVDRAAKKVVFVLSGSGGVEIEELAKNSPEKIHKIHVNPFDGPDKKRLAAAAAGVFKDSASAEKAVDAMLKMYRLFIEKDCSLLEINPYVKTGSGEFLAADAKINFDDNGVFKHPEVEKLRNPEEYSSQELSARRAGLSFVSMAGNIGCIVNGAGLAMATMDVIKFFGGEAANFLDVGGSSNPAKVLDAVKIILSNKKAKVMLINIFGGITRCDDIANGIVMAKERIGIKLPVIIRLIGTNQEKGREILGKAGFVTAETMTEAVKKAVRAV